MTKLNKEGLERAVQVPLKELLKSVPSNAILRIDTEPFYGRNIPVGRYCNEAASKISTLEARLAEAEREIKELREALVFYADETNWQSPMGLPKARSDKGDLARKTLSSLDKKE